MSNTLVLTDFMGVSKTKAGLFLIPFAVGNFLGPLVFGPLFDSIGRKAMISFTYITSGVLLILTGQLFVHRAVLGLVLIASQAFLYNAVFFTYTLVLTDFMGVSKTKAGLFLIPFAVGNFPRPAHVVGTGFAILSPTLFGALIATKSRTNVDYGYLLGAALMIGAGLVAVFLAVNAERRSLEDIARPLTARQRPADVAAAPARAR